MSSYASSHLSDAPSVRFEEECVLIPEVGPIKPRLATRKYSIPLSFHRSTPSEYMYDPSFIPGPPTPTFSIRLPSLSRAPPRPRLKSTSSTSSMTSDTSIPPSPGAGPSSGVPGSTSRPSHTSPFAGRGLERRRSTGQGFLSTGGQVKLTKAAGLGRDGEDAAAQAYMRQYGLKSCLVHEARVEVPGRERERERGRRRRGSLEAEGQHGMGGTNGFGHSHAAGLSSPISFVHPGRITEEPESEEPTPRAQSPASPAPISSSLPSSTRSPFRRGTSALRSRSRSSAGSGVDPSSPRDPALPRIPLRACCAECRLAADLGSRDDAEWAIGFDRKAQEKRARDDAEAARNEGIASMLAAGLRNGGSKREEADDDSGEDVAVAPMKGVVVDEADGVRRRGSDPAVLNGHALPPLLPMDGASDGSASPSRADLVWITTRPRPSPTALPHGPDTYRLSPASPLATEPVSVAGGYFDIPGTIAERPEVKEDSPSRRGSNGVSSRVVDTTSVSLPARDGTRSDDPRIEDKVHELALDDKVPDPPLTRTPSGQAAPAKAKKGGWLGMSISKALGVM